MNGLYKKLFAFLFALCVMLGVALVWAVAGRDKALGELAGSNRLVEQYRAVDDETARVNRELALRLGRVQAGLGSIRDVTAGSVRDIRSAINIITGVKSILETMEDSGLLGSPGSVGSGSP